MIRWEWVLYAVAAVLALRWLFTMMLAHRDTVVQRLVHEETLKRQEAAALAKAAAEADRLEQEASPQVRRILRG